MKKAFFTLLTLATTAGLVSAASIGVSFNSDRDNTTAVMTPTTVAGVVPSTGWVNTDGGASDVAGANGSIANGGVTVDWTSNGTWNTANGVATGDAILMNGYVDAIGAAGAAQVALSGLASFAGAYDVYVYFGSDGNGRTGQIEHVGGATYGYSTFSNDPNGGGGFVPTDFLQTTDTVGNPNANFALYSGLTGDNQTFNILRGNNNSGFHGVQIIGTLVPEPSVSLLGFAGVLLMLRRRR
ncbi:MAG: hypothetical protein ACI9UA_005952 [Pseudoalteromonas tetraodonis]|jgi:hypothetical protein